jgi:hypothetical protein
MYQTFAQIRVTGEQTNIAVFLQEDFVETTDIWVLERLHDGNFSGEIDCVHGMGAIGHPGVENQLGGKPLSCGSRADFHDSCEGALAQLAAHVVEGEDAFCGLSAGDGAKNETLLT